MNKLAFIAFTALLLAPPAGLHAAAPPLHVFSTIQPDAIGRKLQSAFIWADASEKKSGVAIAFRKTFDLPVKPTQAALHLFADVRYVLWVNGSYVQRGPNRFQPNGPEYDTIDLAPCLQAGRNAIAVLVVGNLSGGKVMRHAPGLTAQLEVEGKGLFHTDASWKWSAGTRFRQVDASWPDLGDSLVDARVEDGDWTQVDHQDGHWKPAVPIDGGAWGGLTARRMALLREKPVTVTLAKGMALPVTLPAGKKLEFSTGGRIVQAYPVVEFEAEADTELAIEPFGVRYFAKAGPQRHFTIDTRGISQGAIVVKAGKATITGFRLIERLYPFDRVGSFTCNDAFLNQLWTMCARSCEVLSEDAYVDCADRERVEWMDCDPPAFDVTRIAMAAPGPNGKPLYGDPRLLGAMVRRTALTLQPDGWVKAHYVFRPLRYSRQDGRPRLRMGGGDSPLLRGQRRCGAAARNLARRRGADGLLSGTAHAARTGAGAGLGGVGQSAGLPDRRDDDAQCLRATRAGGCRSHRRNHRRKRNRREDSAKAATDLAQAINTVLWDETGGCYYSGYFSDEDVAANLAAQAQPPIAP